MSAFVALRGLQILLTHLLQCSKLHSQERRLKKKKDEQGKLSEKADSESDLDEEYSTAESAESEESSDEEYPKQAKKFRSAYVGK